MNTNIKTPKFKHPKRGKIPKYNWYHNIFFCLALCLGFYVIKDIAPSLPPNNKPLSISSAGSESISDVDKTAKIIDLHQVHLENHISQLSFWKNFTTSTCSSSTLHKSIVSQHSFVIQPVLKILRVFVSTSTFETINDIIMGIIPHSYTQSSEPSKNETISTEFLSLSQKLKLVY